LVYKYVFEPYPVRAQSYHRSTLTYSVSVLENGGFTWTKCSQDYAMSLK